ncbi:MAG TPA: M23 family metallopeptidase [Candidatus Pacearchaeota archaeon]|nr:M23 family metallopeptidase [Candidatus Pacearchaeota archaeon]HPC30688.1 M23 family metallopeptidase [Candidatus Pacearchaeota archaeon]HQH20050.1 M23 family metallopeptidase [Candidatus Pacearchaeota archaeon]HQK58235.1 M23 family metallopeptidase [Candidatus Pacearchaeota archaeon]HRU20583.1 M23 family metallopeptidase [Candidatus Paceibacterota bacterium]
MTRFIVNKQSKILSSLNKFFVKTGLKEYLKGPKGCIFCSLVMVGLAWGILSFFPFNKSKQSVFAKTYNNFINIEPGAQASTAIVMDNDGLINAIASPLFVSSQTFGAILDKGEGDNSNSIIKYTVQKGETLSQIADKFNISVETILLANELESSKITPGQELLILPVNGVMHMVEKNETVQSLASQYKVKTEDIISFNNLPSDGTIYEGDILIIPGGKIIAQPNKIIKDVNNNSAGAVSSGQLSLSDAYFIAPTNGKITQGAHFSYISNGHSYYNSVDIANDIGTPVRAAAGGQIQIVKNAWPYGNYITIIHPNGIISLYAHLSAFAKGITAGATVTQGQIIGYMGNTGNVKTINGTGSHLHFETRGTTNPFTKYKVGTLVSY